MVLIASITGKKTIDVAGNNTNPPLVSLLYVLKNKRIPEAISYQEKEEKVEEDELTVLDISQVIMGYQEKGFKLIQEQQDALNKKDNFIKDNSKANDETRGKE
eukprot:6222644-Ditylum_brightwellii.AAC.2